MTDPKTISIAPTAELIRSALAHFGIEGVTVSEDGTVAMPDDETQARAVMSTLFGEILAAHTVATMVLPSNVRALREISQELSGLSAQIGVASSEELGEQVERLNDIIANLNGLMGPQPGQ